jgi:hypothetical protein
METHWSDQATTAWLTGQTLEFTGTENIAPNNLTFENINPPIREEKIKDVESSGISLQYFPSMELKGV